MINPETLAQAGQLLASLQAARLTVATAESCTGGLVAASLTHHSGSSSAVLGGFVTYSNEMKHTLLGVTNDLLTRFGAVSAEVAEAMAEGALSTSGADLAVSITGIAGPGGAVPGKPVGLVWFGIARRGTSVTSVSKRFEGDRAAVREAATRQALSLLQSATKAT